MPVGLSELQNIFAIIRVIAKLPEEIRYNKRKCQLLVERIQSLEEPLSRCNISEVQCVRLVKTLEKAREFLRTFIGMNIVMKVLRRYYDKEQFADITQEINNCVHDLNLGILITFDNEMDPDYADEEEDVENEILREPYEENNELKDYLRDIRNQQGQLREIDPVELRLIRKIGEGGFGEVYEAVLDDSRVAVKKLITPLSHADIKYVYSYFKHEIKLHTILNHPHIIKVVGVCSVDPTNMCIVMPFAPEGNLYNYDKSLLTESEKLDIITQLASALNYIHTVHHLLHCDLKSPNILIFDKKKVCISDFGFSKIKSKIQSVSKTNYTPSFWVAPEVIDGESESFSSDIYAFGSIIYEILHNTRPWENLRPSQVLFKIVKGEIPTISPDIDPELASLIVQCWNLKKEERPTIKKIVQLLDSKSNRVSLVESELLSLRERIQALEETVKIQSNTINMLKRAKVVKSIIVKAEYVKMEDDSLQLLNLTNVDFWVQLSKDTNTRLITLRLQNPTRVVNDLNTIQRMFASGIVIVNPVSLQEAVTSHYSLSIKESTIEIYSLDIKVE